MMANDLEDGSVDSFSEFLFIHHLVRRVAKFNLIIPRPLSDRDPSYFFLAGRSLIPPNNGERCIVEKKQPAHWLSQS